MKYRIKITELNNGTITYMPQIKDNSDSLLLILLCLLLLPLIVITSPVLLPYLLKRRGTLSGFQWYDLSAYEYDSFFSAETLIKEHCRTMEATKYIAKIEEESRNLLKVKKNTFHKL